MLMLAIVGGLAVGSTLALAQNVGEQAPVSKPLPQALSKPSKAKRLTDAQLDSVVAGSPAEVLTGGGLTIITNSGNASVLNINRHGHITCINQC